LKCKYLISIIIPVYNVKPFLRKCVESVFSQDFTDYEIILVDDGSVDGSAELCDEIAKGIINIKVIHKKNGGLSSARNTGIAAADGKYITFIDSDDYIEEGYLNYLYMLINKNHADMSVCKLECVKENQYPKNNNMPNSSKTVMFNSEEAISDSLYQKHMDVSACGKLYKKCLFDNISFPIGKEYEDLATTYKLYDKCNSIVYGSHKRYYYVERTGSITRSGIPEKNYEVLAAFMLMEQFVINKYPNLKKACNRRLCMIYTGLIFRVYQYGASKDRRIKEIRADLTRKSIVTLIDRKTCFKDKIKILGTILFPRIYVKLYAHSNRKK